jgi:hypothetical protein
LIIWQKNTHSYGVSNPNLIFTATSAFGQGMNFATIFLIGYLLRTCYPATRQIGLEREPIPRLKSAGLFVWHQNTKCTPDLTLIALSLARASFIFARLASSVSTRARVARRASLQHGSDKNRASHSLVP